MRCFTTRVVLFSAAISALQITDALGVVRTFSDSGALPIDIADTVQDFRSAFGNLNPNQPVSFPGGRREINWDGVPDAVAAPNNLPANFFNVNSPRGVVFSTPGTGFQVSADSDNPTATPVEFGQINPQYSTYFAPFSVQRLFTALDSTITDIHFFVPGTSTPATVRGFGAVFSDVDTEGSTFLQFFNVEGELVATQAVPPFSGPSLNNNSAGQSFAGILITEPEDQIARVRIQSGFATLAAANLEIAPVVGASDLVVMDDFIYAEPVAIPEPVLAIPLLACAFLARRRR